MQKKFQKSTTSAVEERRVVFEKNVRLEKPEWNDFSRDPDTGRYNDRRLNTLFAGFAMGLRAARSIGKGKFVIGKVLPGTNIPIFGERPRLHSHLSTVNMELDRLEGQARQNNEEPTLVVYRSVFARPIKQKG